MIDYMDSTFISTISKGNELIIDWTHLIKLKLLLTTTLLDEVLRSWWPSISINTDKNLEEIIIDKKLTSAEFRSFQNFHELTCSIV